MTIKAVDLGVHPLHHQEILALEDQKTEGEVDSVVEDGVEAVEEVALIDLESVNLTDTVGAIKRKFEGFFLKSIKKFGHVHVF